MARRVSYREVANNIAPGKFVEPIVRTRSLPLHHIKKAPKRGLFYWVVINNAMLTKLEKGLFGLYEILPVFRPAGRTLCVQIRSGRI